MLDLEGMALLCKPGEGLGRFLSRQQWERGTVQMRGDWEGRAAVANTEQPLLCSPSLIENLIPAPQRHSAETFPDLES